MELEGSSKEQRRLEAEDRQAMARRLDEAPLKKKTKNK
jgi:hypothetical protein